MRLNHFKLKTVSHIKRYNSIKARIILSYGRETAITIMKSYNSLLIGNRLKSIEEISKLKGVKNDIKIQLIKEIMLKNFFKRMLVSKKIKKLLLQMR